ncbi:MAG TPA: NAD(P)H-quinone oxidoreductase [Rhodanobacteraceae bacterium]
MQTVEITEPGGPEVLRAAARPTPTAGPGEVLIQVAAAGVNRADVAQRQGRYPPPAGASAIPGLEVAGRLVGGDAAAGGLKVGDSVCALVTGGGYAEYCIAPAVQCLPVPRGLTLVEAAALPETYFTVWSNVFERGRLAAGETLLVHGGASGIGTTAIQLAHAFGHTVYATAGSDARVAAIEALGCTRAINYHTRDFVADVRALTHGRGVDVILDMVAGDYVARDVDALADDGRLVLIATLGGARAALDCTQVLYRRLTITGSGLRSRPVAYKAGVARALRERVWPLLEAGTVRPIVHATFPLAEAARAHALMESGAQIGKIVLRV